MNNVKFSKKAVKAIAGYDEKTRLRIYDALSRLPYGDIKKLRTDKSNKVFRLRVGKYRLLFTVDNEKMEYIVLDVDSRGNIYKK